MLKIIFYCGLVLLLSSCKARTGSDSLLKVNSNTVLSDRDAAKAGC